MGGSTSRTKDGSNRPRGATVMVASAACPGLGQLLNGKEPKAAIVSAVETFLVAGLIIEDRRARNSLRLYRQTNDDRYYDEYSEHFDRRQTLVWWAAVAALYGMVDAYVDAHLVGFDDSPAPRVEGSFGGDGTALGEFRVAMTFRF
ncbi:MAG: hypothetical protein KAJ04_05070 [Candidatus Eisenbacteria sp.]|nr:hypothetical protein [Candidatus Eisenbacteria bacterium]